MQIKLLSNVINEIAGKIGGDILNLIYDKRDVNEFLIAKKLNLTINQVRNTLYKLTNFGLVTFTRKKDKRKGWYTYFWTLNIHNALELLNKNLERETEALKAQLKSRQNKRFYVCDTCKTEVTEETALSHDFICPECGEVYRLNEDKKILEELEAQINKLAKYKASVLEELTKVKEEKTKKLLKESNKKAELKKKIRAKERKKRLDLKKATKIKEKRMKNVAKRKGKKKK